MYVCVIRCIRVKVKVKILERNLKKGFLITFVFVADSKVKMNTIGSIFGLSFHFNNP